MQRQEQFDRRFFPEMVLREAAEALSSAIKTDTVVRWASASTRTGAVAWNYDNEDEFFVDYKPSISTGDIRAEIYTVEKPVGHAHYSSAELSIAYGGLSGASTTVRVTAFERAALLRPFTVFRAWEENNPRPVPARLELPPKPPLKIFIGHGRSHDWRDLKDALQDQHGYIVETFEAKPRAGFTIPEVIEAMARDNALALMVLTAEDEQSDGSVRARENVVHEVGYFQGRLGSKRAILLMQEGVNEFSNIHGIVHVPYGNIREVVGEVLALIKREFPDN